MIRLRTEIPFILVALSLILLIGLYGLFSASRVDPWNLSVTPKVVFFLGGLYTSGMFILRLIRADREWIPLWTVGFWLRVILGYVLGAFHLDQDEEILHVMSLHFAEEHDFTKFYTSDGYAALLAWLYIVVDPSIMVGKGLNAFATTLAAFFIAEVAGRLQAGRKASSFALSCALFLPPMLIYGALNLKEGVSMLILAFALWIANKNEWSATKSLLGALSSLWLAAALRPGLAAIVALTIALWIIFRKRRENRGVWGQLVTQGGVVGVCLLAAFCFGWWSAASEHIKTRLWIGTEASWSTFRQSNTAVISGFLNKESPWNPRNVVVQLLRVPFSPSPLSFIRNPTVRGIMDSALGLTLYLLWPFALIGAWSCRRQKDAWPVIGQLVATSTVAGFSLMLALTIQRQGLMVCVPIYALASIGFYARQAAHAFVVIYMGVNCVACVVYLVHHLYLVP